MQIKMRPPTYRRRKKPKVVKLPLRAKFLMMMLAEKGVSTQVADNVSEAVRILSGELMDATPAWAWVDGQLADRRRTLAGKRSLEGLIPGTIRKPSTPKKLPGLPKTDRAVTIDKNAVTEADLVDFTVAAADGHFWIAATSTGKDMCRRVPSLNELAYYALIGLKAQSTD